MTTFNQFSHILYVRYISGATNMVLAGNAATMLWGLERLLLAGTDRVWVVDESDPEQATEFILFSRDDTEEDNAKRVEEWKQKKGV